MAFTSILGTQASQLGNIIFAGMGGGGGGSTALTAGIKVGSAALASGSLKDGVSVGGSLLVTSTLVQSLVAGFRVGSEFESDSGNLVAGRYRR